MKELKNLEAIRELLASHPIYTYDYSDGLYINKEATNIQVVTNLFIPEQKEYHIQLSGNYPEESEAWDKFLEENQWKIYPLLANIMQVFLPTGNYQLFYTRYPQGFISIIAKPHDK